MILSWVYPDDVKDISVSLPLLPIISIPDKVNISFNTHLPDPEQQTLWLRLNILKDL